MTSWTVFVKRQTFFFFFFFFFFFLIAIWLDKRFKPFSDKSVMIDQTLYRLNGNACCNFIGQTPRHFEKRQWRFKNGVYEPFSYRFSNVFVYKKNRHCHCTWFNRIDSTSDLNCDLFGFNPLFIFHKNVSACCFTQVLYTLIYLLFLCSRYTMDHTLTNVTELANAVKKWFSSPSSNVRT